MSSPLLYSFTDAARIESESRAGLLGGKGAALVRMTEMGLPVPPGFVVTTETCHRVTAEGWFAGVDEALSAGVAELERDCGRVLGSSTSPLLVSVRSGAPVSMPGMMDTVLNVGMNNDVAASLAAASGDERFAWDTARRFVQSYSSIVLEIPEQTLRAISIDCLGADEGRSLAPAEIAAASDRLREQLASAGFEIPDDPISQLRASVAAVFGSWESERARSYRAVEGISETLGTAVTVQMMTFGNLSEQSGTGVAFTRDPSTGERALVGDLLVGAQGEDVVAGTHSTLPLRELSSLWPSVAAQLDDVSAQLELDLCDLADIEFTVEDGKLWLLQVRRGKCSPVASLRIAIDLAEDPAFPLDRVGALDRVGKVLENPPTVASAGANEAGEVVLVSGLAASPGCVAGRLYTEIDAAIDAGARDEDVVLMRPETSPADVAGMAEAIALVTGTGGLVSHAAVVARSWGLPAVVGATELSIEPDGVEADGRRVAVGDVVTVDGTRGVVLLGDCSSSEVVADEVAILRRWQRELDGEPAVTDAGSPNAGHLSEPATAEACERVLALKGAATAATVAEVLGCPLDRVELIVSELMSAESVQELPGGRLRLLPSAGDRVDARFAAEAARLSAVIEPVWEPFHRLNDELKQVVASWQLRKVDGNEVPNDHADPAYDAQVVDRLRAHVHVGIVPIVELVAASEPRFSRYTDRLDAALVALEAGDSEMFANPLRDSYHTVWFELHEELIRLTGRNRADEAAAGRA